MPYLITLAKSLMVVIWGLLITNLLFPFPGKLAIVFDLLFAFIFLMHSLQLLIIYGTLSKKLQLSKSEAVQVFLFGFFKIWQIKGRLS